MLTVSRKFRAAIKLGNRPAYRYAQEAGIDPTVLSKIMNGAIPIKKDDSRVLAVARIIGLKADECFQGGRANG